jgi:16S rRNA (cytidine1402-2'-O)-methyltransferase
MSAGRLYLIPNTLGNTPSNNTIPEEVLAVIRRLDLLYVENIQSASRYLQWIGNTVPEYNIDFFPLDKHTSAIDAHDYLKPLLSGRDGGIISEAGCPGVADPGSVLVKLAHSRGIEVHPLVGPSSILLALMASGFNGQQFAFHGYLPIDKSERKKKITELENESRTKDQTQIFMEAPHRNTDLFKALLNHCRDESRLCVAADLTLPGQYIQSKSLAEWRSTELPDLHKRPAIFLLYWK